MELIERYLEAVGRQVPLEKRSGVLTELRNELAAALESRFHGEPSESEVIQLLKELGPPEKVAASHYPEGQYLVGPALFPLFRSAVRIALLVVVIVHLVLIGVLVIFAGDVAGALRIALDFFGVTFTAVGVVVLVFYVLQRTGFRPQGRGEEWDPRSLPEVESPAEDMKRGEAIAGIAISAVFLTLFMALRDGVHVVSAPGGESWTVINPVLNQYLPLIVVSLAIGIAIDAYLLWKGRWTAGRRLLKLGSNILSLFVLGTLLSGHQDWLQPYTGGVPFLGFVELLPEITGDTALFLQVMVMWAFWIGLTVAFIVEAIETVVMIFRLARNAIEARATA